MPFVKAGFLIALSHGLSAAAVAAVNVGGELTIATDYMYRGVSQTMSDPALQAEFAVEHDAGWYGWVWASNVDFVAAGAADDGADLEINIAVGYNHEISESLAVSIENVAYVFPGTRPGYDYDYTEWLLGLSFYERHCLTVGYSGRVFGTSDIGRFYAASTTIDLMPRASLDIELGYYDLQDALAFSYGYAEAAIVYDSGPIQWRLSYLTSNDEARTGFDPAAVDNRLVVAISMSF